MIDFEKRDEHPTTWTYKSLNRHMFTSESVQSKYVEVDIFTLSENKIEFADAIWTIFKDPTFESSYYTTQY